MLIPPIFSSPHPIPLPGASPWPWSQTGQSTKCMLLPSHLAHAVGLSAPPTALFQCWPVVGQMPSLVFYLTRHPPPSSLHIHRSDRKHGKNESIGIYCIHEILTPKIFHLPQHPDLSNKRQRLSCRQWHSGRHLHLLDGPLSGPPSRAETSSQAEVQGPFPPLSLLREWGVMMAPRYHCLPTARPKGQPRRRCHHPR
jgi:hypothetical protein